MNNLIDHLSQDSLPVELVESFVNWCVWQQSQPAFLMVLRRNKLEQDAQQIQQASSYFELTDMSNRIGLRLKAARTSTGPLGLSTAEAAAFLMSKLARAATEADWDPEGLAFFAVQLCGWAGYAETDFTRPQQKTIAEAGARLAQEQHLRQLWQGYQPPQL